MAEQDIVYEYQPLWENWKIDSLIGKGKYGRVYRVSSELLGEKYHSAIKVITFPYEGFLDIANIEACKASIKRISEEIKILYTLKGNSNIVSYEDSMIVKRTENDIWDIIIRMEYLTPLKKYLLKHTLTVRQIISLAMDVCMALEICLESGILHGDIKEDNIFVTEKESFKLGDFGVARWLGETNKKVAGTPAFMAPELFNGEKYNITSDLYSLGIVLYKLLNNGNLPFVYPESNISENNKEKAFYRRISGEKLFPPLYNNIFLTDIILKMCAYNPKDRYSNPTELKKDFKSLLDSMGEEQLDEKLYQNPENIKTIEFYQKQYQNQLPWQNTEVFWGTKIFRMLLFFLPVIISVIIFIVLKLL